MRPGAVIVAAGAGVRLGGVAKALLRVGEESFLARIARLARAAGAGAPRVVVVGPPFGDAVAAHARELGLGVVVNPAPERGMASSVALGFAALVAHPARAGVETAAAWLWPVDHPSVQPETLAQLQGALGAHAAAVPRWRGRGGHPPLVARALWPALAAGADTPGGARAILAAADTIDVAVDDPGVVRDVDTPADQAGVHGVQTS